MRRRELLAASLAVPAVLLAGADEALAMLPEPSAPVSAVTVSGRLSWLRDLYDADSLARVIAAYRTGETVTATEMTACGLLLVGEGSRISNQAVFVPTDEQDTVRLVTVGVNCQIGPLAVIHGGVSLADGVRIEEHAVIGKPEHGYAVGRPTREPARRPSSDPSR